MITTLKTFPNMREAVAALTALSDAYHKAHRKRETLTLMVSSYSPAFGTKGSVEICEVRGHYDDKDPEQVKQARWFAAQP